MKKELFVHFSVFVIIFFVISLAKFPWFLRELLFFWFGGLSGTFLLDVDHLIYAFFWRPHELTPQRATRLLVQGKPLQAITLLADSHRERTQLLAHTVAFQVLFVVLSFWVLTSSASIFGKGLVLGVFAHILVDQALDFKVVGDLRNWFWQIPKAEGKELHAFWLVGGILVFLLLVLIF